jgi:hypothetical protein
MTCPGRGRHIVLRLWVTLVLVPLSSIVWAEGTDRSPHSLIHRPSVTSPAPTSNLTPSQAQSTFQPVVPHTLLKKPTPPSLPLAPAGAVPSVSLPQLGASPPSMNQLVPTGTAPTRGAGLSTETLMGRSAAPITSATAGPRTAPSRLPSALQRLFRDNPIESTPPPSQSPPSTTPPVSSINKVTLTWTPNKESDLAGYKVYVGTSSGTYDFPGSPFVIDKIATYVVTNLQQKTTYFFAVSAFDHAGNESPLSTEVSKSIF